MVSEPVLLITFSILVQLVVAVQALRLIPVTGRKVAWLVCLGLTAMAFRRFLVLQNLISGGSFGRSDFGEELMAIVGSFIFFMGITTIRAIFEESRRANQALEIEVAERKRVQDENEALIVQLREALAHVKQLSGMLPICSSCKKIRNDKGYWEQIDVYIRDHSEADFTHGLCPECAERLYPELYGPKKGAPKSS